MDIFNEPERFLDTYFYIIINEGCPFTILNGADNKLNHGIIKNFYNFLKTKTELYIRIYVPPVETMMWNSYLITEHEYFNTIGIYNKIMLLKSK